MYTVVTHNRRNDDDYYATYSNEDQPFAFEKNYENIKFFENNNMESYKNGDNFYNNNNNNLKSEYFSGNNGDEFHSFYHQSKCTKNTFFLNMTAALKNLKLRQNDEAEKEKIGNKQQKLLNIWEKKQDYPVFFFFFYNTI
jgi:hypothetical protein